MLVNIYPKYLTFLTMNISIYKLFTKEIDVRLNVISITVFITQIWVAITAGLIRSLSSKRITSCISPLWCTFASTNNMDAVHKYPHNLS